MAVTDIRAVPTAAGRALRAQVMGGVTTTTGLSFFRYGEGGFVTVSGGLRVPADPDDGNGQSTKTDIVAQGTGTNSLYFIQKSLTSGDLAVTDNLLSATCTLELGEANDRGDGTSPTFFEIGVFDSNGVMIAYGTFPQEEKTSSRTLTKVVKLSF